MDSKEIKILFNYLDNNRKQLTALQFEFFASSKKIYNATCVLTQRQVECLQDIKESISSPGVYEPESYRAQYSSFDHLSPFV